MDMATKPCSAIFVAYRFALRAKIGQRAGTQPFAQLRPTTPARDVAHCDGDGLLLSDQHDQPLAACDAGVEKVPLQHGVVLRHDREQTAIRRLIAASKINCEFLAPDRWKVEGKQRIVAHGGCGGGLIHIAIRWNTDLLRESLVSCHSRLSIPHRHA